jgi:hypothetical protein
VSVTVDDQLGWERRLAPRAAVLAILAGLLTLAAGIYTGVGFKDVPRAQLLEALDLVVKPGPIGSEPSLRVALYEYYHDHSSRFMVAALINALGTIGTGAALAYLAAATRARRQALPRIATRLPWLGAVLLAVGYILYAIGTDSTVNDLLDGPRTVDAVNDVKGSSLLVAGQLIELVGRFALGAALVLISLNAMRCGLLTRFMGVLGILVGVLLVVPLLQGPPVVQCFWLIALGALFLGQWPRGVPPAWRTGKEEPWPSNAEMRAARTRARPATAGAPADVVDPPPRSATPHPSSKKRKRKRRG